MHLPEPNFDCDGNCTVGEDCEGRVAGPSRSTIAGYAEAITLRAQDALTPQPPTTTHPPWLRMARANFQNVRDLNGDLLVSVADILEMLGDFGCVENCDADLTGDNAVSVEDLLTLLANFGLECPE